MAKFKKYILHILLVVAIWAGAIWGIFEHLDDYSMHGQTITVPDLRGLQVNEIDTVISSKGLRYQIIDSVYSEEVPLGAVIKQDPKELSQVKLNRNIYVTINSNMPQRVKVPNLINLSKRMAVSIIESFGLEMDIIDVVPDECRDCVLAQLHEGKNIKPGTMIEKGEKIKLVVGGGESRDKVGIPNLLGKHLSEAKRVLDTLNLGLIAVYDVESVNNRIDSLRAVIYRQDPPSGENAVVNRGSSIDLYLKVK
ncbi:MAG: PASTA domain-containing protein [Bacteroidetes bacterium]|nr:PASTA domain-containing protein [Bacteroidota bacterium]